MKPIHSYMISLKQGAFVDSRNISNNIAGYEKSSCMPSESFYSLLFNGY